MPTEVYVAILVACVSVTVMAAVVSAVAIVFKNKMDGLDQKITSATVEMSSLVQEGTALVKETRVVVAKLAKPAEDLEKVTQLARAWTERADGLAHVVSDLAETPLFLFVKSLRSGVSLLSGLLGSFTRRKE